MKEQGTDTASSTTEMPPKRKRGRPRKSNGKQGERSGSTTPTTNIPCPSNGKQGERSGSTTPTTNIPCPSNGKERVEEGEDDEMVGQMVTGIVENEIDGGYLLKVRVGDNNVCLRGVVFKEGSVVPVTPVNDIAPDAKMYNRTEYPIPDQNSSSVVVQTADMQQQEKILCEDVTRNGDQIPTNGKLDGILPMETESK